MAAEYSQNETQNSLHGKRDLTSSLLPSPPVPDSSQLFCSKLTGFLDLLYTFGKKEKQRDFYILEQQSVMVQKIPHMLIHFRAVDSRKLGQDYVTLLPGTLNPSSATEPSFFGKPQGYTLIISKYLIAPRKIIFLMKFSPSVAHLFSFLVIHFLRTLSLSFTYFVGIMFHFIGRHDFMQFIV